MPDRRTFKGKLVHIAGSTAMVGDFAVLDEQENVLCFIRETNVDLKALDGREYEVVGELVRSDEEEETPVIDVVATHLVENERR